MTFACALHIFLICGNKERTVEWQGLVLGVATSRAPFGTMGDNSHHRDHS